MNTPTLPASTEPAPTPGRLGIGEPKAPTIDGDELVSDWLARNGVKSVKGRVFGVARIAELLTVGVEK